ncbi:unnamed protein product, partial [Mesorhabditis spiculigera]
MVRVELTGMRRILTVLILLYSATSASVIRRSPLIPTASRQNQVKVPKFNADAKFVACSDADKGSRTKSNTYESECQAGRLIFQDGMASVEWLGSKNYSTHLNVKDRGMELSELIQFKGEYLAPDDKTGIVYKLKNDAAVPWVYLGDGDGQSEHAFKTEWMTVKGNAIYAGSHGTEWLNDDGSIKNYNRMFVKKITTYGNVFHLNWTENYQKLRSKLEIDYPGYVIHEAVLWSEVHKRWFFLPRQVSRAPVMKNSFDNMQGSNLLLTTSDCFCDITITEIGPLKLELGTNDNLIVAIKTFERAGYPSTSFLMLFDIHGQLFLDSVVDNLLPAAMPFLLTIYKDKDEADKAWEFLVSSRIYGLAVGCFLSVLFSNRFGRRTPILIGTLLDIFGVVLSALTVYLPGGVTAAVVGRFINGIGQGIVQTSGSVMLAEIPPLRKRGTALATLTMWACMGELGGMLISLEELLGTSQHWHLAMAVPLLPLIPALYILYRAPESPRYLFMLNREIEARKALSYYQNSSEARQTVDEIFEEMKLEDIDFNANNAKMKMAREPGATQIFQRLKDGYFARPLLIALFVQSFVHLDDWLWISYSTQIFENVGLTANRAQRASLLMSLPQAIISPSLTRLVVFGMLAIFFTTFEKALLHGIPIAIILPVLAAFDLSAAAISGESAFAIVPELFLHNDKILGTAIVGIAQNVFGGILTNCLLTAVNHLGTGNVLVPFVGMNVVYVVVNYWYLPETAEKTPQEVSIHFSADPPLQGTITYMSRKLGDLYHFFVPAKLFSFANILNILIFVAQVAFCVIFMNVFYGVGVQIFRLLVH